MHRKVIIVYNSEIFRKGLGGIIKSFFNVEVVLLSRFEEIFNLEKLCNLSLVLFCDPSKINIKVMASLYAKNCLKTIAIRSKQQETYTGRKFDANIHFNTTSLEIQKILEEFFVELKRSEKESVTELSQREIDVLRLVALGHSNKSIADELFISIHTVISHRKNITEKLGIKSISGLTIYAIINNLINPENIDILHD